MQHEEMAGALLLWLKNTPTNTSIAPTYCTEANRSPSSSQPKISVNTGIKLTKAEA